MMSYWDSYLSYLYEERKELAEFQAHCKAQNQLQTVKSLEESIRDIDDAIIHVERRAYQEKCHRMSWRYEKWCVATGPLGVTILFVAGHNPHWYFFVSGGLLTLIGAGFFFACLMKISEAAG